MYVRVWQNNNFLLRICTAFNDRSSVKNGRVVNFPVSCCKETEAILLLQPKMDPGTITIIYHNRGIMTFITILMKRSSKKRMGVVKIMDMVKCPDFDFP